MASSIGSKTTCIPTCLSLRIVSECSTTKARICKLCLPHQVVDTPVFMPVGTQGTMKGLTVGQLNELECQIILGNTYHMGMRPGPNLLDKANGLHSFMNWKQALLTDSGGFQMVSLLDLAVITEEGVKFRSPYTDEELLLTPEKSMQIQNSIGADIMMQLDDVVHVLTKGPRVEEAMHRSVRWLDRCIAAHKKPSEQALFAIVQGGLDADMRKQCALVFYHASARCPVQWEHNSCFVNADNSSREHEEINRYKLEMIKRDTPGFAIGGLSGGESKDEFWKMVNISTNILPKNKPRYLMGVGYAVDLVVCCALGVDMYDCVFPTRTARFGSALVDTGSLNLRSKVFANDLNAIDNTCLCSTCQRHTRAYLHAINKETVACHLITVHNIAYQMRLMKLIRQNILEDTFPAFIQQFMSKMFPSCNYPTWVVEALATVNVKL